MADISKVTVGNETYNVKDNAAIAGMTSNGTTVTYTKRDGSTGTFQTQDTVFNYQVMTQADYDSIAIKDQNKFYFIKE